MADAPDLQTVAEVAEQLKVHEKTLRRWIAEGRIPVVRIGRLVRISRDDLEAFLRSAA